MTEAHQEHDTPHEGPIKTPKQVILAVFFSFLVPIAVITLLASYVATSPRPAAGSEGLGKQAVAERIRPVGRVEIKDVSDVASMKTGEQVFGAQCTACHSAGVAGAPKLGDAAAWGPRLGQGVDALLHSALKGKGAMGPQGGGDYSDVEIARAVVYMTNKAGGTFPEPKPPAAGDAATAAAPAQAGAAAAPATAVGAAPPVGGIAPTATGSNAAPVLVAAATAATPGKAAPAAAPAATAAPTMAAAAVPALYTQACQVCHAAGIAGAPKLGDKAAWAPRLAQGIDGLTASAIKGKGAMPPRGGSTASDADIKAVVAYMVESVK